MANLKGLIIGRLKLRVNEAKSAVDVSQKRKFLGFTFTADRSPNQHKIAPESLRRFKTRVRQLTRRNWKYQSGGAGAAAQALPERAGAGILVSAKPHRCYVTWAAGFAIVCVVCDVSSGRDTFDAMRS